MNKECEMCGGKPYKEVETEEGMVTMCKECYTSFLVYTLPPLDFEDVASSGCEVIGNVCVIIRVTEPKYKGGKSEY